MKKTGRLIPTISDALSVPCSRAKYVDQLTKVALIRVEPGGHAADVSDGICATSFTNDCGETDKHWSLFALFGQKGRSCDVGKVPIAGKVTVSTTSSCMYNSFWDLPM